MQITFIHHLDKNVLFQDAPTIPTLAIQNISRQYKLNPNSINCFQKAQKIDYIQVLLALHSVYKKKGSVSLNQENKHRGKEILSYLDPINFVFFLLLLLVSLVHEMFIFFAFIQVICVVVQENGKLSIENEPKMFTSSQNVQIVMVCTFLFCPTLSCCCCLF